MGFRTETILIKPAFDIPNGDVLKNLGISDFKSLGQIPFEEADSETGKSGIYIGKFNGCTILIGLDFVDDFLDTEPKGIEKKIFDIRPNSEVLAIVNNEFDNSYIYSYSVSGVKKRLKVGNAENLWLDYGDIHSEEKLNYKSLKLDENNNQIYEWIIFKRNGDIHSVDQNTHDQVGGEMGFRLCKMLIDVWYFDIEDIELEHFQVSNFPNSSTRTGTDKKWWTHR